MQASKHPSLLEKKPDYTGALMVEYMLNCDCLSEARSFAKLIPTGTDSKIKAKGRIAQALATRGADEHSETLFREALDESLHAAFESNASAREGKTESFAETDNEEMQSAIAGLAEYYRQAVGSSSIANLRISTFIQYGEMAAEVGMWKFALELFNQAKELINDCQRKEKPFQCFKVTEALSKIVSGFTTGEYPLASLKGKFEF